MSNAGTDELKGDDSAAKKPAPRQIKFRSATPPRSSSRRSTYSLPRQSTKSPISDDILPSTADLSIQGLSLENSMEELEKTNVLQRAAWFLAHSNGENQRSLMGVGRTLQRTSSQLRKTRLFHLFYLLVLPVYTVVGAWIFKTLDGEYDDRLLAEYKVRCQGNREEIFNRYQNECIKDGGRCFEQMKNYLDEVEQCYRRWHAVNRTVTHSMNEYKNALVYAFSVYTTIGYGNMAADTYECRLATVFYGVLGIPLFFAFVKEEGNLFRNIFISLCKKASKWHRRRSKNKKRAMNTDGKNKGTTKEALSDNLDTAQGDAAGGQITPEIFVSDAEKKRARFARKQSASSLFAQSGALQMAAQRKIFLAGVLFFCVYVLSCSLLFSLTSEFDYFTSVYFLFNSVALIGFGDVFPRDAKSLLINAPFIVLGVVLFSMCYFILQEEIRNKAFEASRRARISISKYSHTIMQHASRSGWSRRNSPLMDVSPESAFERMRKRRQSAPALTLTVPLVAHPMPREV